MSVFTSGQIAVQTGLSHCLSPNCRQKAFYPGYPLGSSKVSQQVNMQPRDKSALTLKGIVSGCLSGAFLGSSLEGKLVASRGESKPLVYIHRGSLIQKPYNEWTWEEARCCGNLIPLLPRAGFLLSSAPGRGSFPSTLLGEERQDWCSLIEVKAHFLSVANCHPENVIPLIPSLGVEPAAP